jgi:hypothetical protein
MIAVLKDSAETKGRRENLENYVKAILYIYPRLGDMERDYEEHIKNKAFMSYDYRVTTEALAEYIAAEIITVRSIAQLKGTIDEILGKLTRQEKLLLELRYFRRKREVERMRSEGGIALSDSRRNYFRRQDRLLKKVGCMMKAKGLTEGIFFNEYICYDWMSSVYRFIEEGRVGRTSAREKALVRFLSDSSDRVES